MSVTTKPMRPSASVNADARMKTVNARPWTSGWRAMALVAPNAARPMASTDNTETVTDNSHDSSFDVRLLGAGYPNYLDRAKTARVTLMRRRES